MMVLIVDDSLHHHRRKLDGMGFPQPEGFESGVATAGSEAAVEQSGRWTGWTSVLNGEKVPAR
jgi:hypothetical protein